MNHERPPELSREKSPFRVVTIPSLEHRFGAFEPNFRGPEIHAQSLEWAARQGILLGNNRERFDKQKIGHLTAWVCADLRPVESGSDPLQLHADMVLWLFASDGRYDGEEDTKPTGAEVAALTTPLREALTTDSYEGDDPFAHALFDIRGRVEELATEPFQVERWKAAVNDYFDGVELEAELSNQDVTLTPREYTDLRDHTSAQDTLLSLVDVLHGNVIPPEDWDDPDFQLAATLCNRLTSIGNDLVSYRRERDEVGGLPWSNLITHAQKAFDLGDEQGVINWVIKEHNEYLDEFEALIIAQGDFDRFRDRNAVKTFMQSIMYWAAGMMEFSAQSSRYRKYQQKGLST